MRTAVMHMHDIGAMTDERLAQLIKEGDETLFSVLAVRYRAKAVRVAYGILHNASDAEDAVQEAFIRIYRGIPRFSGASQFSSWAYRVVVNESLRLLKTRRSERAEAELGEQVAARDADAAHSMHVRQCLAALPSKLRVVLALRGIEELDYAEIAEILEIPVGTVRSRLHEARKLFAKCWEAE